MAPVVPEDREQRQEEVGLLQLDSFAVDPNEDLRDVLLIDRGRDLQRGKRVLLQIEEAVEVVGDELHLVLRDDPLRREGVEKVSDDLVTGTPVGPHRRDVRYLIIRPRSMAR